jgi:hypothetical protein
MSASDVLASRYWLEMIGVTASADAAKVIQCHSFGNWTMLLFIKKLVSTHRRIVATNLTIASFPDEAALPDPASIFINFVKWTIAA